MSNVWTTEKLMEWESALRSGKYPMGFSSLANKTADNEWSYCCLGVGCEVLGLPHADKDADEVSQDLSFTFMRDYWSYEDSEGGDATSGYLPFGISLPFGGGTCGYLAYNLVEVDSPWSYASRAENFVVNRDGGTASLGDCNDSREFTQDQLADLVHFFFVVPSMPDGPRDAYQEAVAVDISDTAKRAGGVDTRP